MELGLGAERAMASLRAAPPRDATHEAGRFLSAVFLRELVDQMWKTVPEGGLIRKSAGEKIFRDFMNDKLASDLSRAFSLVPRAANFTGRALQKRVEAADTGERGGSHGRWMG